MTTTGLHPPRSGTCEGSTLFVLAPLSSLEIHPYRAPIFGAAASRLGFDCTPKGMFLGLHVNGKRVSFTENVIYEFGSEKIVRVWSVIDKAAIEAQL
jgi:hypothetical protein